ncbi:MAG TPA: SDR family oxidoreductase [Acidimicrobiia bacterium]|jgi:NAD(P)-dependent dehydrogenase (short-subunit alcohol dehydrogenase family)|nr:SDR family oxidoreductase [Acidimicrobiia bacterium]
MRRVVVTGANRGLGLEFARQLDAAGDEVVATTRHPKTADELNKLAATSGGRVTVVRLDVGDPADVEAAALHVGERFDAVDLLINNAGIWTAPDQTDRASSGPLADLRPDAVAEVLRINAVAPLAVTQALAPRLAAARRAVVVNLSSGLGSLQGATRRGNLAYGMSKAALNMLTRQLAAELAGQGTIVVSMSPGWVATDMGGPSAPLEPPESVKGMLNVLDALTPAQSGSFLDHAGAVLPW